LRGRVGVEVLPQNALIEWIEFPTRRISRGDLPRKRER